MACRFSKVKINEDEKVGSNKTEMIEALGCLELKKQHGLIGFDIPTHPAVCKQQQQL
jgi:hypothetical protein